MPLLEKLKSLVVVSHLWFVDYMDFIWRLIFAALSFPLRFLQRDDKEKLLMTNPCLKSSIDLRMKSNIPACCINSSALQLPLAPSPTLSPSLITKYPNFQYFAMFLLDPVPLHMLSPFQLGSDNPTWKVSVIPYSQVRDLFMFPPSMVTLTWVVIPCWLVFLPHETKDRLWQAYSRCSTNIS